MIDASQRGILSEHSGRAAEETAMRFLTAKGMHILERRLRTPYGELDLLVKDETHESETFILVEVKSSKRQAKAEQLSLRQLRCLSDIAEYLPTIEAAWSPKNWLNVDLRIDLILISPNKEPNHIENIGLFF